MTRPGEYDDSRDAVIQIDANRSITIHPVDNDTIVLTMEDPHTVAVVEMQRPDVVALYEALDDWMKL